MKRSIMIKENQESKVSQHRKTTGPDNFTGEFYQTLKEYKSGKFEFCRFLLQTFLLRRRGGLPGLRKKKKNTNPPHLQKIEEEGTLPNSFFKASITLIPKPDKDTTRKDNIGPIFLINTTSKILKILASQIQEHNKTIAYYSQVGFICDA